MNNQEHRGDEVGDVVWSQITESPVVTARTLPLILSEFRSHRRGLNRAMTPVGKRSV